jgi:hypothetical protein
MTMSGNNHRLSYVEPEEVEKGKPCRGCDMPDTKANPVYLQGYTTDGRPLYGHNDCQSLIGSDEKTSGLPVAVAGNLGLIPNYSDEKEDIWAFASVNKYDSTQNEINTTLENNPHQAPDVRVDAASEYSGDGTGASVPPSK